MKVVHYHRDNSFTYNIEGLTMGKIMAIRHALEQVRRTTLQDEVYDMLNNFMNQQPKPVRGEDIEVYYQPDLPESMWGEELYDHEVFKSKEIAQRAFPDFDIREYRGEDIGERVYVDDEYSFDE